MQIQEIPKLRSIYEVALEIGTSPAGLRSLIAARKIPAEKVSLKKGVRPMNAFTIAQERIVKDYFQNRPAYHKLEKVRRKQSDKAEQLVYSMKEIQEVPFMAENLNNGRIIWADSSNDAHGKKKVSFDFIELEKLLAHVHVKIITDQKKIGFCVITKGEEKK